MRADNITSYKQMLSGKLLLQISVKLNLLIHWSLKVECLAFITILNIWIV